MYIKKSIDKPHDNSGVGLRVRGIVSLIDVDDILSMPDRDDKGVRLAGNIVMKNGCYSEDIYVTQGTVEVTSNAEGDTDQVGFQPQVKFNHPGNSIDIREFKANSINRRFIVVVRYCDGRPADIIGSVCNPCKLLPAYTGNSERNVNEITLQQIMRGEDIGIYEGTVPSPEPVGTITTAAVAYIADGQYQVADGATTINKVTGGSHGSVITILGAAGVNATVSSSGEGANIILKDGRAFTAGAGSQLTLRAFKDSEDGLKWIELSRFNV